MELTVNNPNLHPVWAQVLGVKPQGGLSDPAAPRPSPLAAAIAAMTGAHSQPHGWTCTTRLHSAGAPVGAKRRVGPGLWISTVAMPGDPHYPVQP